MANRVANILEETIALGVLINNLQVKNHLSWQEKAKIREYMDRVKRLKNDLALFGTRYHLVKIKISYYPYEKTEGGIEQYGNLITMILFLTDITKDEAISYIKYRYHRDKIDQMEASRVPLGNPIQVKTP